MNDIKDISNDLLIKSIKEILETADLNVMTSKLVRDELKTKLNVNELDSRKKQINSIINDVINDLNSEQNNTKVNKVVDKDDNNCVKSGAKVKTEDNNGRKSSDSSDDSLSDDDIRDEDLARKLHNEELDSKRRVTRRSDQYVKKKATNKKSTKKKSKNNSDDDTEDKPKTKQKKTGYLKPCILSPELAEFLGESQMARHEVVKRIWSYVKEKNLLDPKNKQFVKCDHQLLKIFGNRKRVRMFGMMKFLAKHIDNNA